MSAEQWQRRFEWPIAIAALAVIPILIIEDSDAGGAWPAVAAVLNWCSSGVFLAEIVVMLSVVRDRRAWLLHHPLDVAIVVLTPPFIPLLGAQAPPSPARPPPADGRGQAQPAAVPRRDPRGGRLRADRGDHGRLRLRRGGIPAGPLDLGRRLVGGHDGHHRRLWRNRGRKRGGPGDRDADHVRRHRVRRPRHRVHRRALRPQGRRRGSRQRGRQGGSDPRRAAAAERRGRRAAGARGLPAGGERAE